MLKIQDRVLINRLPQSSDDPDEVWFEELEEIIGSHGTVLEDKFPYTLDSIYIHIDVDNYTDLFLPISILTVLT